MQLYHSTADTAHPASCNLVCNAICLVRVYVLSALDLWERESEAFWLWAKEPG